MSGMSVPGCAVCVSSRAAFDVGGGGVDVVVWLWTTKSVPLIVPASCVLRLASRSSQKCVVLRVLVRRSSQTLSSN